MEEKLQILITTIWEQSLNVEDEELIIKKIHKICFKDQLRNDQIKLNLFKYLEVNSGDKDRKSTSFRRKIIDFLKELLLKFPNYSIEYLEYIKQSCSSIYISEQSLVVKEKILSLISKIVDNFDTIIIEKIFKPKSYIEFLLDEIKLKRLGGTIKGGIWHIIGILVSKFSILLNDYKIEIHDVLFYEFKNLIHNTNNKLEFKAVVGILKSYVYLLEDPHLTADQTNILYIFLKSMVKPLDDANSIKINKLALDLISTHGKVFFQQIQKDGINLFDDIFSICNHKNQELKMAANEAIEKISIHISDSLIEDNSLHKDAFKYLIIKIKGVLETRSSAILINTAISLIGIFSNAIVRFMGESILEKYLEELIVLFDRDIIYALGREAYKTEKSKNSLSDIEKPSKSIKYVLAIQKQYISLLNSYSNIIANLTYVSELIINHFYKILLVGFSTHQKFYEKYKIRLCDSIASVIVNMFKHQNFFWSFLRKVIKNGFIESIKLTTNMLFKETVEQNSILNAVNFWINLINRDKIFTEFTLLKVFDQLMTEIVELFSSLNLNYKEIYIDKGDKEINECDVNIQSGYFYEAEDLTDLEICNRVTSFLREFLKKNNMHKLLNPWVVVLLNKLCYLANKYSRISALYTGLSSLMKYCRKINFFKNLTIEIKSFINEFDSFNKNIIKKLEIFQDDLLLCTIDFLLSQPVELVEIIFVNDTDSIISIFKKAFDIGYNDIRYAKLALKALSNWKFSTTIKEILPIFGEYLIEYEKIKSSINSTNVELIEKYNKIQDKIFRILGEMGGDAHHIISSHKDRSKSQQGILNIMNSKTIEYSLPLYNKKYPVYFDHILIKIAEYAQNSFIKEKKYSAAEFFHSVILYIIGLETKKTTDNTNILVYLIDKVLNLACDLEKGISLIYETLLFQIIHWMAKKGSLSDNKDIISMLDIIIENTSSRKNLKLRDISAECIAEYIKWFIKQHTDFTIKEKAATVKYIVRRIESIAQHPDAFKRLGSILCFEKIVPVILLNDSLVDKFAIEICYYCLSILKFSHNSSELSEIIFEHVFNTIEQLLKMFKKKFHILIKSNSKRNFFKDLFEFWGYLLEKHLIVENDSRYISQFLWYKVFDLVKSEFGYDNHKQFFCTTGRFPIMTNCDFNNINATTANTISFINVNYHFINFILKFKILNLNDIYIHYPRYSIENNINDLKQILGIISENRNQLEVHFDINIFNLYKHILTSLIYVIEVISINDDSAKNILKLDGGVSLNILIESILDCSDIIFSNSNFKKFDSKFFIFDSYNNLYSIFLENLEKIFKLVIHTGGFIIEEKIENYLVQKIPIFKILQDRNNFDMLYDITYSDISIDFYFKLLSLLHKSSYLTTMKSNFKIILSTNQPKFKNLIKNYFNFLFTKDFLFITEIICENEFNFDYLADYFFASVNTNYINYYNQYDDFINICCYSEEKIFLLFILMEKAIYNKSELKHSITGIYAKNIKKFCSSKSIDAIIHQIKIANLILCNYLENSDVDADQIRTSITNISVIVEFYINEKSINIAKEIVNYLGLMVKLQKKYENIKFNYQNYYQNIQLRYFPIKTKYLKHNTKEFNDFQLIYNALLNTFKTVKSFEFLELLFPIIREEKTEYSVRLKLAIKEYTSQTSNLSLNEIQKVLDVFNNVSNSNEALKDNIRFTLMKVLGFKLFKKCDLEILKELFILNYQNFENTIKKNIATVNISNEKKLILILEKSIIFKLFEICFFRFPTDLLKNVIHKKLFGENSQGNELTKFLILELHNAKRMKIPDWDLISKSIKSEEIDDVYLNQVENKFYCSAYNCLANLIKSTQTKEEVFVKFLFQTFRDKNEKLWELLLNQKFVYSFNVETNFIIKDKTTTKKTDDLSDKRKSLLIDDIITDSFFHDAYGKTLKSTLVFEQKTLNLHLEKPTEMSKILIENLEDFNKSKISMASSNLVNMEEDIVNKHPIMENFLMILDTLYNTFSKDNFNPSVLPSYMQHILAELKREDTNVNIKIFLIKVIINKPEIFHNYLKHFLPALIKFSSDKNNGGKGFHYFLRDIATLIISCKGASLEFSRENVDLVSNYINHLAKVSGDRKNIIFRTNLRIISDLMEKFNNLIFINKKTIVDFLKLDDSTATSHIWKISGVQILASAMDYNIPIGEDYIYSQAPSSNKFISSIEKNEDMLHFLFKLIDSPRTPVQSATIELLAKILTQSTIIMSSSLLPSLSLPFKTIYDYLENLCISKTDKIAINIIFRTSLHYRTFLLRKKVFNKSLSLFKFTNQNNRNLLLQTFNNIITHIIEKNSLAGSLAENFPDKNLLDDIYYTIYELIDVIFVDPNDEIVTTFTSYILNILKFKQKNYIDGMRILINKLNKEISRRHEYTRITFYNFLSNVYLEVENPLKMDVINLIIINLDKEPEQELKKEIIAFLNKINVLPADPVDRLLFLLENLAQEIVGEKLIQTVTKLLLILSANSADYNLKIYQKSLSDCEYQDLKINTVGYYLNRSQPIPPSTTIRNSMDEAYQTIVNVTTNAATQLGYLRSTLEIENETGMITEGAKVGNNNYINNVSTLVNVNLNANVIMGSPPVYDHDSVLSQYSSLISSTQTYSNMNQKPINTGLKLTESIQDFKDFKEPLPRKKPRKGGFGKFLSDNEMLYNPMINGISGNETNADHKIRFVPDGSVRQDNRKYSEGVQNGLIRKWLIRQSELEKKQVKLMRQYRIGDLPDILISNREIIDPLILLCDFNLEVASELFLEIMNSIYIESIANNKHNTLHQLLESLLKKYKISNFLIVSCLHRFMLNMMIESDQYIPDLYLIQKTGLFTKNYHSSILILEEFILNSKALPENISSKRNITNKEYSEIIDLSTEISKTDHDIIINSNNKSAWTKLLKFYSRLKLTDYEVGLIQNFADYKDQFIKNKSNFLQVLSSLLTKSKHYINKNIDINNLLKAMFNIYDNSANNFYDNYDTNLFIDDDLKETIEEYTIKYCSDFGEWDNLTNYLLRDSKILTEEEIYNFNPDKVENLLKAWVYSEDLNSNKNLSEFIKSLNSDDLSHEIKSQAKIFLEETFTHYMSLYCIIQRDYDQALLYHQKAKQNFFKLWLNLGVHSGNLRHEIIPKLQKINEISEFLEFMRGTSSTNTNISFNANNLNYCLTPEGCKNVVELFNKWMSRWPNYIYDEPIAFEEIYSERKLLFENFNCKFYNFEHSIPDSSLLETFFSRSNTEISTAMFKKGFLDLAENHTKKALQLRKDNSISNAFIILPVIRNKYKILEIESANKDNITEFNLSAEKYEKLIKVLNDQIKNVKLDLNNKRKLNILRVKMYLNVAFNYLENEVKSFSSGIMKIESESENTYSNWLNKGMKHFNEEVTNYESHNNYCENYIKLLRPVIKFSDKIIRKISGINYYNQFIQQMNYTYIENSLKALIMGDKKVINTIPKLLDILSKDTFHENLINKFNELSPKVNSQYFLKWKNQLMAYINTPISKAITPIINNILDKFPQSLYFPFTVIEKYSHILIDYKQRSELFKEMKEFYSGFKSLNSFVEALDGLTNPEHRLKYWLENLKEVVNGYISSCDSDIIGSSFTYAINKISNILEIINYDILELNKNHVGQRIGSYNSKFSKDFEKLIKTNLSIENFKNLLRKRPSEIIKDFVSLIDPISKNLHKTLSNIYTEGIERLSTFSEWLAQYECSEFSNPLNFIELPNEDKKVMISSFDQHLLILPSIRRPKRLIVYGNDEKSYMFLVKGGEDIRLDQRIMEIFKAYNEILAKDSNCCKKNLRLNKFSVFPMTLKLGLIEWVNNTTSLKNVIKYSMNKLFKSPDWDLKNSPAQVARLKWLNSVTGDRAITEQHYRLLHMTNSKEIVNAFTLHENLMPKTVLKKGLEHYLLTPEEVLSTRVNFVRNYSALCIACYILGIGDRHLENFLIDTSNSEILAIDFGVAFGQGVTQIIPELVPFRFTNQIRNVIYPFGKKGAVRQTMIDTMTAFRNSKEYILDYCEVFVKEPLLDWIKLSKSKLSNVDNTSKEFEKPTNSLDFDASWLPMKKLNIIESKLSGANPIKIIQEELLDARHHNEKTVEIIRNIVSGEFCIGSQLRNKYKEERYIHIEDQVDLLIEQACDKNLLARMWSGWSPYI